MKKEKSVLRHLFVPGHHNNHHPAVLSHAALTAYLVIAVASFIILRNISTQTNNVLGFATDISPSRVIELTNDQRQSSGLGTLTYKHKYLDTSDTCEQSNRQYKEYCCGKNEQIIK